ncbi:hypothetical protein RDI58_001632 [Solanum bulbocastanum]|uniref:Xylanase inhibitor N-terminal domain-containing protein n=1 Tax=Solanum bulbocastanum TaxID=147425 RepID=A0AAN8YNC5_SOLBU
MVTFKLPLSILLIFLLLNIFQCSSEVLYIPVTKDASTLQYIIEVGQKTPLIPTKLLLHLGGKSLWVDCTNSTTQTSSTYKSAVCNSTECSMAKSYGCGDCKFRSELQPGCNNNTCYIWGENPIKKMYEDGSEVAEDVLTIGSSPGFKSLRRALFSLALLILICSKNSLMESQEQQVLDKQLQLLFPINLVQTLDLAGSLVCV